jgi:hypothetical protein
VIDTSVGENGDCGCLGCQIEITDGLTVDVAPTQS